MGTHAIVNFGYDKEVRASLYIHYDGYPEYMLPFLEKFFDAVEKDTNDTRFNDPEYLAAKLVLFYVRDIDPKYNLGFTGIGVTAPGSEEEYVYFVDSGNLTESGRPTVTLEGTE